MTALSVAGGWGPGTSRDRVHDALRAGGYNPRGRRDDFMALCPVHEERTPSLHVTWSPDGGRVLLKCFGCDADQREIAEALGLGLVDLFDEPPPERDTPMIAPRTRRANKRRRGKLGPLPARRTKPEPHTHPQLELVETYPYVDLDGVIVQEVHRKRCTECGGKEFTQSYTSHDGSTVTRKPDGFTPVLYCLPDVVHAVQAGQTIWLLEGEKDVHTAQDLGLTATTNAGGGRNLQTDVVRPLAGAQVNVVLDRDGAGWDRGVAAHQTLLALDCEVRLLIPAVTRPKADLTDHVEAGHTLDALIEISPQEAAVWAAAARAMDAQDHILITRDEIEYHLDQADQRAPKAPKTAAEHKRYATRWATEAEHRYEKLAQRVDEFAAAAAVTPTSTWTTEARTLVDDLIQQATTVLTATHELVGRPLAEDLIARTTTITDAIATPRQLPANEQPLDAADSDDTSYDNNVVDFPGNGGGSGGGRRSRAANVRRKEFVFVEAREGLKATEYGIFERKWRWQGRGEDREEVAELTQLLNLDLRLEGREYVDDSDVPDSELADYAEDLPAHQAVPNQRVVSHYLFSYTDIASMQRVHFRVEAAEATTGDFLDHIGVTGLLFDQTKSGKATVFAAVRAVSTAAVDSVQYRGTGWRNDPTHGWSYVTYSGLITADGVVTGHQNLTGVMSRYALPSPTSDAGALRRAFLDHSASFLDRFPARVGAVLLGHCYVAPVRRNPYSVVVQGSPGSKKTGLCALAMHHFGIAWDRTRPTISMTHQGATANAASIIANQVKDAVALFDDVTPSGNAAAAQTKLGDLIQTIFNQAVRDRSERDGSSVRAGLVPHATALFSSELQPKFGANARRAIVVPLQVHELELQQILDLDQPESRMARARLMASMLSWAAQDLPRARQVVRQATDRYAGQMRDLDLSPEEAEWTANLWGGWTLMTQFLLEAGAIDHTERNEWLTRAHEGLHAAVEAGQDPDSPTNAGQRLRELIASGLRAGVGHVTDLHTDDAPDADGLAIRLGWRRIVLGPGFGDEPPKTRIEASGRRVGYVNTEADELLLDSTSLEAFIKAAAAGLSEPFSMDAGTARRALHETGILKAQWDSHGRSGGRWRYTMRRTIYCEDHATRPGRHAERFMTVLSLSKLLGDADDTEQPPPPAPLPLSPAPEHSTPAPSQAPQADTPDDGDVDGPQPEQAQLPLDDPEEQTAMYDEHPPIDFDDPDVVAATIIAPAPCSRCEQPARTAIDGVPVHPGCWGQLYATTAQPTAPPALVHDTPAPAAATTQQPPTPAATPAPAPAPAHTSTPNARQRPNPKTFTAPAAVVDTDTTYLPDGTTHPTPPITHLGHIAQLAYDLNLGTQVVKPSRATRGHTDPGVVVLTEQLATHLNITTIDLPRDGASRGQAFAEAHTDHDALTTALADGWNAGRSESGEATIKAWTRMWRDGEDSVLVTFVPLLQTAVRQGDAGPERIAHRLGEYARLMGTTWHLNGHTTGTDLMQALRVKSREEFVVHDVPEPARKMIDPDLDWCRKPTDDERELTFVHAYDRGGSHLAGVASLELPVGDFEHHPDGRAFDPKLPGYWQIEVPDSGDWRYPHPIYVGQRERAIAWVTTPTLALATSLDYDPKILQAFVWPKHARVLDPWYARIRDARAATDAPGDVDLAAVRDMIKETYTRSIGMMGSAQYMEGRPTFYPERRHHIVAKARANLLRRVIQIGTETGVWPLAVKTDTIVYPSDEADPIAAWPGDPKHLGHGLGQYKVEGTGELADQLPFLQGGRYPAEAKQLIVGEIREGDE